MNEEEKMQRVFETISVIFLTLCAIALATDIFWSVVKVNMVIVWSKVIGKILNLKKITNIKKMLDIP